MCVTFGTVEWLFLLNDGARAGTGTGRVDDHSVNVLLFTVL